MVWVFLSNYHWAPPQLISYWEISSSWARLRFVTLMDLDFFCKKKPKDQAPFKEGEFSSIVDKSGFLEMLTVNMWERNGSALLQSTAWGMLNSLLCKTCCNNIERHHQLYSFQSAKDLLAFPLALLGKCLPLLPLWVSYIQRSLKKSPQGPFATSDFSGRFTDWWHVFSLHLFFLSFFFKTKKTNLGRRFISASLKVCLV